MEITGVGKHAYCINKPLYKHFKYIYRSTVEKCYFFHQFNTQQSTTTDLTATHNNIVISHLRFMKCRTLSIINHPEIPQHHTTKQFDAEILYILEHIWSLDCTAIRFFYVVQISTISINLTRSSIHSIVYPICTLVYPLEQSLMQFHHFKNWFSRFFLCLDTLRHAFHYIGYTRGNFFLVLHFFFYGIHDSSEKRALFQFFFTRFRKHNFKNFIQYLCWCECTHNVFKGVKKKKLSFSRVM